VFSGNTTDNKKARFVLDLCRNFEQIGIAPKLSGILEIDTMFFEVAFTFCSSESGDANTLSTFVRPLLYSEWNFQVLKEQNLAKHLKRRFHRERIERGISCKLLVDNCRRRRAATRGNCRGILGSSNRGGTRGAPLFLDYEQRRNTEEAQAADAQDEAELQALGNRIRDCKEDMKST